MPWFAWFGRPRRDRAEAERLISEHGSAAWQFVYSKCRNCALPGAERAEAYRVRRIIERRLKTPARVDRATRYLEL